MASFPIRQKDKDEGACQESSLIKTPWLVGGRTGRTGTIFNSIRGDKMMKRKRQLHDGIAGALITTSVALGYSIHPGWLLLPGILGVILLQNGFTGFCPVYFILDRTCPAE